MKKILLSGLVILTFAVYVFRQNIEAEEINVITPVSRLASPTSLPAQPQNTPLVSTIPPSLIPIPTDKPLGKYKDGEYTGSVADAYYGNIQVKVIISGGRIADVVFLQSPNDRSTSIIINSQAMPYLKQEAIQVQNAGVDIVSGATDSSLAFRQSLQSALNQAI